MVRAAPDVVHADVAVVGSGVAGLAAALEAARAGAAVVVVEAERAIGGASAISGGGCCIVGTPAQRVLGIDDDIERALTDWRAVSGGLADLDVAERYLRHSVVSVWDYVRELGLQWQSEVRLYPDNSAPRWHRPEGGGGAVVAALERAAAALGVRWVLGSRVEDLEPLDGEVRASARRDDGGQVSLRAGALVMATGGFSNSPRLIDAVLSDAGRPVPPALCGGGPDALGDGHRLLDRLGARLVNMDNLWYYPVGVPNYRYPGSRRGLVIRGIADDLWFSLDGRRFHDETDRSGRAGSFALAAQPGAVCWAIQSPEVLGRALLLDDGYFGTTEYTIPSRLREFLGQSSSVVYADDLTQLCALTGLPENAVAPELSRLRALVAKGAEHDPTTGRPLRGISGLEGPFAAVRYELIVQKTFGGVLTDGDGRVAAADGGTLPRIFACGELAGMAGGRINGAGAIEGTMFGPSLWSGQLAGQAAAQLASPLLASTRGKSTTSDRSQT